jgi:hypothetical protein
MFFFINGIFGWVFAATYGLIRLLGFGMTKHALSTASRPAKTPEQLAAEGATNVAMLLVVVLGLITGLLIIFGIMAIVPRG